MNKHERNISHRATNSRIYDPFDKNKSRDKDNPFSLELSPWSSQSKHFQLNHISKNQLMQDLSNFDRPYQAKFTAPYMKPSRNSVDLNTVHSKVSRYLQSEQHTNRTSLQTSKRNRNRTKDYGTIQQFQNKLKPAKLKNISLQWDADLIYSPQKKYKQQILQARVSTALVKDAQKIVNIQSIQGYQPNTYQLRRNKIPKILSRQKRIKVLPNFSKEKDEYNQKMQEDQFSDYQLKTHRVVYNRKSDKVNIKSDIQNQKQVSPDGNQKEVQIQDLDELNHYNKSDKKNAKNIKNTNIQQNVMNDFNHQSSPKNLMATIQIDFQKLESTSPLPIPIQKYQPYKINRNKNGYRIYNRGKSTNLCSSEAQKKSWIG